MHTRETGLALLGVIIVLVILVITGMASLILAEQETIVSRLEVDNTKAFYLAEAGLAKMQEVLQQPVVGDFNALYEETLEDGQRPNQQVKGFGEADIFPDEGGQITREITLKYVRGALAKSEAERRGSMSRVAIRLAPERLVGLAGGPPASESTG